MVPFESRAVAAVLGLSCLLSSACVQADDAAVARVRAEAESIARVAARPRENEPMSQVQPEGFLALPKGGTGDPVLVLHPWWGLNETIRDFCRRLAGEGFVVFAPDLYHGKVVDTIVDAEAASSALLRESGRARAEVAQGARFLSEHAAIRAGRGIAVIGFSMGAFYALDLSAADPERVRSVVLFYGSGPADFVHAKADFLGHFAEKDEYEPQKDIDAMEKAAKGAGRSVTFHRYPGTGHWFFESDVEQAYDPAAAKLAWERTLAFLKRPR
jgi:carboxymethylenebutenolidase